MPSKNNNVFQFPRKAPPEEGGEIVQITDQIHINPGEVLCSYIEARAAQKEMDNLGTDELKTSLQGLLKDFNSKLQQ